ncbi:ras-like GTP-binding protein Rho1 [Drosophila innubila]|uniref:ras-like GTP-binding protein Rho1 n=1 Tax=Drosophila innubila TaxID=198719 RepID=UPI00148C8268|nr:ras-like GTP-binding protein Rho1 [Drosophila innubila]
MLPIRKQLAIVGGACGKTSMITVFRENQSCLNQPSVPTVWEHYEAKVEVEGLQVELLIKETNGNEDYDRLRPLSYPGTDVVVIVFSIDCRFYFEAVSDKWKREIRHYLPNVPIILVGNKRDLRSDPDHLKELAKRKQQIITKEEGMEMAQRIKAFAYLECSALTQEGVREVFETATRASFQVVLTKNNKKKCVLL